jgi:hypothetical protein
MALFTPNTVTVYDGDGMLAVAIENACAGFEEGHLVVRNGVGEMHSFAPGCWSRCSMGPKASATVETPSVQNDAEPIETCNDDRYKYAQIINGAPPSVPVDATRYEVRIHGPNGPSNWPSTSKIVTGKNERDRILLRLGKAMLDGAPVVFSSDIGVSVLIPADVFAKCAVSAKAAES